jgi:hypothetical protein
MAGSGSVLADPAGERAMVLEADPAPLHGTLLLPTAEAQPIPGVLILAGSGPVDRDGNLPHARNDSLRLLAQGLARRGIASLRIDKRGIGASGGAALREDDLRFETYVADAARWLDRLRAEPGIARVGVIGHSEGALVATLAVQSRPDAAGLVLLAGAGFPAGVVLRRQFEAAAMPDGLRENALRILVALEQGRMVADVPGDLAPIFRPSVQPYLASWLPLDPATELTGTRVPTLIVQGTTDLQVSEGDARRLASARPDAEIEVIAGMNHVLKHAPIERAANFASYADPTLPVVSALIDRVAAFLGR